jgi:preprotein translocase subunit SecD
MSKFKALMRSPRVWILIICVLLSLVALHPNPLADGVVIKAVARNSSAVNAGIESPKPNTIPSALERLTAINNKPVHTIDDYLALTKELPLNRTVQITTNRGTYKLMPITIYETVDLGNETRVEERNVTINGTSLMQNVTISVPKTAMKPVGMEPLGLSVVPTPTTNLRKGLDLQGGTRVLLRPEEAVDDAVIESMVDSMKERLNVYGLSDITVTPVKDRLQGGTFILVELAGATEAEARNLLSKQGKFEAKIGDETVFKGGNDITYVCRTAECSGIDPNRGCMPNQGGGYSCSYFFAISLSAEAAARHASITRDLAVIGTPPEDYLSQNLTLFLDDALVRELRIGASLKGSETTQVQISGFGTGVSQQEAMTNTLDDMKQLQTVLVTGSLPAKIVIEKIDTVSPKLGSLFIKNALIMGLLAIVAVTAVLLARYRKVWLALPIVSTVVAEIVIIIGWYALSGSSLDLAAIAGIIVTIGTGVDHQVIITDETIRRSGSAIISWADKLKQAFFIIFSSVATVAVAMFFLYVAGAGLLRGFAVTTMVGLFFGLFVTRPAYAKIVEIFLKE